MHQPLIASQSLITNPINPYDSHPSETLIKFPNKLLKNVSFSPLLEIIIRTKTQSQALSRMWYFLWYVNTYKMNRFSFFFFSFFLGGVGGSSAFFILVSLFLPIKEDLDLKCLSSLHFTHRSRKKIWVIKRVHPSCYDQTPNTTCIVLRISARVYKILQHQ